MKWDIDYLPTVITHDLPNLSKTAKLQIKKSIEEKLTVDPIAFGKPLQYSFKGHRRLRVGDYRIIFRIDQNKKIVTIVLIGHRRDVYE